MSGARISVSAIVPCYNAATTIARAITSICRQTSSVSEIIVIDDASEDETVEVAYALANETTSLPIRVRRLRINSGPSTARNTAWDMATGEYLAFLDADDTWHPYKIELQSQFVAANPKATFLGHSAGVMTASNCLSASAALVQRPSYKMISWRSLLVRNPFQTSSVIVKADVPARFDPQFKRCEDYLLWCELTLAGHPGYWAAEGLAFFHKPAYGASGLSGDLWKMASSQRDMLRKLRAQDHLSRVEYSIAVPWSWLKLMRRYAIVATRS
jgi:glycosyltransferase involved in cell wall biosynthesis